MDILERWELTPEELTEIVDSNPSLRGIMLGYVAEYQLRRIWFSGGQFQNVRKFDNHDRSRKADLHFAYKGVENKHGGEITPEQFDPQGGKRLHRHFPMRC